MYRFNRIKIALTTFFVLMATNSNLKAYKPAVQVQDIPSYIDQIHKHIRGSFKAKDDDEKKVKASFEQQQNKKAHEVDRPNISELEQMEILLAAFKRSVALKSYLAYKGKDIANMPTVVWEGIKLFQGPASSPHKSMLNEYMRPGRSIFEVGAGAIRFTTPMKNIQKVVQEQEITSALLQNKDIFNELTLTYNKLAKISPSLLALCKKSIDPLYSKSYQGLLCKKYPNSKGKFTSWITIESSRRIFIELMSFILLPLAMWTTIGWPLHIMYKNLGSVDRVITVLKEESKQIAMIALIQVVFYGFLIKLVIGRLIIANEIKKYISGRLSDLQILFEVMQSVSDMVERNPILQKHCAHKLVEIRKLLNRKHKNPEYNKLADIFLTHDFKNWHFFINSFATLLTTMTLLDEHIRMLDSIFFELGQMGTYLSFAYLIEQSAGKPNGFVHPTFIDQQSPYIQMKGGWNTAIPAEYAVANDMRIGYNGRNTFVVMGPNACGKSQLVTEVMKIGVAAGVGAPTPAEEVVITLFDWFFLFKEPQEDASINKSLFARELDYINEYLDMLIQCKEEGKKSLTCFDEFLGSTNPEEGSTIQVVLARRDARVYRNNLSIISTHNPYMIAEAKKNLRFELWHVMIDRHPDGSYTPLYKIGKGETYEKVGIDLFENATGEKELAKEARRIVKEMMDQQRKIQVAAV